MPNITLEQVFLEKTCQQAHLVMDKVVGEISVHRMLCLCQAACLQYSTLTCSWPLCGSFCTGLAHKQRFEKVSKYVE